MSILSWHTAKFIVTMVHNSGHRISTNNAVTCALYVFDDGRDDASSS